jgi:signal peptidase II
MSVAATVVALDALSKALVAQWLRPGQVIHAGPLLELDLYYNHAGARNALTGHPVLVSVISMLAIVALLLAAARMRSRGLSLGFGFLIGGGIGNLVDRLAGAPGPFRGGVIDWLRPFGGTGSMNLADLAINLGLLSFAFTALYSWMHRPRRAIQECPVP